MVEHAKAEAAVKSVFGQGGLLEQAKSHLDAGTLLTFFQGLLSTLGPIIGPIIISLLQQLLHIPASPVGASGS